MNDSISQNTPQDNPSHKKRCSRCRKWQSFRNFSPSKSKDGLYSYCYKCARESRKERATPEKTRNRNYRRLYDITVKQYDRMFAEQNGLCAICSQPETARSRTGEIKPLAVDHDHVTNEVRMLLCQACNLTLGVIEENLDRLDVFFGYMEEMKKREPAVKTVQLRLVE